MITVFYIAVAGAIGTLCRYAIHTYASKHWQGAVGTFVVNVVGCLLIALFLEHGFFEKVLSKPVRLAISVGFFGAFTTFSTFGYETMKFLQAGAWGAGLGNIGLSVGAGLLGVWLGFQLSAVSS